MSLALLLCGGSAVFADSLPFGAATGFKVFVFKNFSEYGTDAQGRMAVGGNFSPAGGRGFTIAGSRRTARESTIW